MAALFTIARLWNEPWYPSIDEWIKKTNTHTHTHTHRNFIQSQRRKKLSSLQED
jgi:hypothetical protein